jgi:hypothetical protein
MLSAFAPTADPVVDVVTDEDASEAVNEETNEAVNEAVEEESENTEPVESETLAAIDNNEHEAVAVAANIEDSANPLAFMGIFPAPVLWALGGFLILSLLFFLWRRKKTVKQVTTESSHQKI